MTVKIYSLPSDAMSPPVDSGFVTDFVLASDYSELQRKVEALAAECANLKSAFDKPQAYLSWHSIPPTWDDPLPCGEYLDVHDEPGHKNSDGTECWPVFSKPEIETPATDAALAEIRNQARAEGVNFAASRLAAAFNHGFVEKPMAEVFDITRMILDARGDLDNGLTPPADGLSGEYAESALKQWEEQLNKESDHEQ